MQRKFIYPLIATVLFVVLAVTSILPSVTRTQTALAKPADTASKATFTQKIDAILAAEPDLAGSLAGISVRDAQTGTVLYGQNSATRMAPASNMKLFTAAAALATLGADYTFKTEVLTTGTRSGSTLTGDLYLKGYGDPTLLASDMDLLAKQVKQAGITKVQGQLIADDTWYDNERLSTDISWVDESYYYGGQISALTASPDSDYDAGSVLVTAGPADKAGAKPVVTITPQTSYINIVNEGKTTGQGTADDLYIVRNHGDNTVYIGGNVPLDGNNTREWIAVWEPTGYALDLFKQALENNGISVSNGIDFAAAPLAAKVLYTHKSMPLREIMTPFMKRSNNIHAEMLVKEMGRVVSKQQEGSWAAGLDVVKTYAASIGVDTATLKLRDGSGMSASTGIPPEQLTQLLFQVQDEAWFDTYLDSLPLAGNSDRMVGGTLGSRMAGTAAAGKVHAKTGSISGVSTLSGYVDAAGTNERKYVFSVMLNNMISTAGATRVQNQIAILLAEN
jgi:D-alanyl-D-alanine carboxypeptidase/D-alanyl-D-alanine-endopeptidase (penicillin-binding protein 4)